MRQDNCARPHPARKRRRQIDDPKTRAANAGSLHLERCQRSGAKNGEYPPSQRRRELEYPGVVQRNLRAVDANTGVRPAENMGV